MTPTMQKIQLAIFEIIKACLLELKSNKSVTNFFFQKKRQFFFKKLEIEEDLTIEENLFKNYDIKFRQQLDSIWNQVQFFF